MKYSLSLVHFALLANAVPVRQADGEAYAGGPNGMTQGGSTGSQQHGQIQSSCTGVKKEMLEKALGDCATRARAALETCKDTKSGSELVKLFFKNDDEGTRAQAAKVFGAILKECEAKEAGKTTISCGDEMNLCHQGQNGYTSSVGGQGIFICDRGFQTSSNQTKNCGSHDLAFTVLHEMSHSQAWTDDIGNGYGMQAVTNLPAQMNLRHADTYSLFAQAVSFNCTTQEAMAGISSPSMHGRPGAGQMADSGGAGPLQQGQNGGNHQQGGAVNGMNGGPSAAYGPGAGQGQQGQVGNYQQNGAANQEPYPAYSPNPGYSPNPPPPAGAGQGMQGGNYQQPGMPPSNMNGNREHATGGQAEGEGYNSVESGKGPSGSEHSNGQGEQKTPPSAEAVEESYDTGAGREGAEMAAPAGIKGKTPGGGNPLGHSAENGDCPEEQGRPPYGPGGGINTAGGIMNRPGGKANGPPSSPEGQTTYAEGEKQPEGEVRQPEGEVRQPDGETTYSEGEAKQPEGEAMQPEGETNYSEGEAKQPGGETTYSKGEARQPEGETTYSKGEAMQPGGNVQGPGGKTKYPGGKSQGPGGETGSLDY
ncbi:hypothetical protein RJ55_06372 [Drechmeria coniospora]|nr:hypothetical protein RJ55_06372 [Drechmeria coniospora]